MRVFVFPQGYVALMVLITSPCDTSAACQQLRLADWRAVICAVTAFHTLTPASCIRPVEPDAPVLLAAGKLRLQRQHP